MKIRTEVPISHSIFLSCHLEFSEVSNELLSKSENPSAETSSVRKFIQNPFIINKSEVPVKLKALFLLSIDMAKKGDGSIYPFSSPLLGILSKTSRDLSRNALAFEQKGEDVFKKRLHLF